MDPKFQSSFIPKGPLVSTGTSISPGQKKEARSFLAFLAFVIFTISVLLALGVFGYKFYLQYRIGQMGSDLEKAQLVLQPETISELTRLNNRIISAENLISRHRILTPLFAFLETSTLKNVRFSDFSYSQSERGLELSMHGEARGYAALALQADIFSKSKYFKEVVFSDLNLDEKGDVIFSFKAIVDRDLLSYSREVEQLEIPTISPATDIPVATTTATTTTATSTPN
jgi:nitrate reductase NapE component